MTENPYPGLRPYQPSEADLFFGRDEHIEELLARLRACRFVAVVGTSGGGKSSLVRAGLVPALEGGYLTAARATWRVLIMTPGGDPLGELAAKLSNLFPISVADVHTSLLRSSVGLAEFAKTHLGPDENLLVVVDQFEEVFRYHQAAVSRDQREAAAAFIKLLLTAAGRPEVPLPDFSGEPVFVVLTMRSDFLGKSAQFRGLAEALNDSQYLVPRMTREQLQEAIEGPAAMLGARMDLALVQRLLNDSGDNPDHLPVLQHVLMRVWEVSEPDRAQHRQIGLHHLDHPEVGGLAMALNLDADRAFNALGAGPRAIGIAVQIFKRLVNPGAEDEESRRPTPLSELVDVCEASDEEVRAVIKPFQARGFLLMSEDKDPIVDISHESLIRLWDKLKAWVKEEATSAAVYTRLVDWIREGFQPYSGLALQQALLWRQESHPNAVWARRYRPEPVVPFQRAMQFLDESAAAAKQEADTERLQKEKELRRARTVAAVLLVAFLAALVAVVYVLQLRRTAIELRAEADREKSNALSRAAEAVRLKGIADTAKTASDESAIQALAARDNAARQKDIADAALREATLQKKQAGAERLGAAVLVNLTSRPDLAALLSVERSQGAVAADARDALLLPVLANPRASAAISVGAMPISVAFNPDGKLLAVAREDGVIELWDTARRRLEAELRGHKKVVFAVAFSPDGRWLASGGDDDLVRLWDVARRELSGEPLPGHSGAVRGLAFRPDGRFLASASEDKTIRLWDVADRKEVASLRDHDGSVSSVVFTSDGKILVSGSDDKTVRLWDVTTSKSIGEPLKGHSGIIYSVAISADGKLAASASADGTVRLWDLETRSSFGVPLAHQGDVIDLAFSPTGLQLASTGTDRAVRLWELSDRANVTTEPLDGHAGVVFSVAFSPDGKTLASAGQDRTVRFWDARAQRADIVLISKPTMDLAFRNDDVLVSVGQAGRIWDLRKPGQTSPPAKELIDVTSIALTGDTNTMATVSGDGTVRLWSLADGLVPGERFNSGRTQTQIIAMTRDGRVVAVPYSGAIRLFDARTRQPLAELTGGSTLGNTNALAFSPDGRTLAVGADRGVTLWDVIGRRVLANLPAGSGGEILAVKFSPDGRLLATGSEDASVSLWNVALRRLQGQRFTGHLDWVRALAFSPDGRLLASGSDDGTVRVWDVVHHQPFGQPLTGHSAFVRAVAFSPSGRRLASAGDDGTIQIRTLDVASLTSRLCHLAGRNLSALEWQLYLGSDVPYRRTCPDLPPGQGVPTSAAPRRPPS